MLLFLTKLLPALLFPVGLTILLCLWVSWRCLRDRAFLTGFLAFLTAALVYTAASPLVSNRLMARLEKQYPPSLTYPKAAAIVLLGGGMLSPSAPRIYPETGEAGDRVIQAGRLWRQKLAPKVVTTGGYIPFLTQALDSDAEQYASLLRELFDVPDSALLQVATSLTTIEDAEFSARLFDSLGMKKEILLVTSASHMPRAAALFRKQGFTVTPAPTDFNATVNPAFLFFQLLPSAGALNATTTALKEYLGSAVNQMLGRV